MPISANTLFHFTRDYETLLSILNSKFYPRQCLEDQVLPNIAKSKFAIPMACFCDIPLSQISEHSAKYGNYAIGIKKDWAIHQGVSPVLYTHDKSTICKTIEEQLKIILDKRHAKQTDKIDYEQFATFLQCAFMMKPYEGSRIVDGKKKKVTYYNEREWRYVPPIKGSKGWTFLTESLFKEDDLVNKINEQNETYGVDFDPDQINYIIVNRTDEILPLKREIHNIKGDYPMNSVELLETKIISMQQIKDDF